MMAAGAVLAAILVGANGLRRHSRRTEGFTCGLKGNSGASVQIVNGDDASVCEWPWQVNLNNPAENNSAFCGGTLISPEWVLTAAHCVDGAEWDGGPLYGPQGLEVALGAHHFSKTHATADRQDIAASEVYLHPLWNKDNSSHDIALIRLEKPAKMSSCVRPACLPTGGDVAPKTSCWITGWGTFSEGGKFADILQEAEVKIWSYKDCTARGSYEKARIDDSMICAQGGNWFTPIRDACQGDSGGPLVCEGERGWTVYGATSWGDSCGNRRKPGIWARVHTELDWIESTMANAPAQAPRQPRCQSDGRTTSDLPDKRGRCICKQNYGCLEDCQQQRRCQDWSSRMYRIGQCEACKCYTPAEIRACTNTSESMA